MKNYQTKPKILIVDDKTQNLFALEKTLNKLDVEIVRATSGNEALNLTLKNEFSLAIVDVQMPEMDGYELVDLLRGNPDTSNLPVIFVSAIYSDEYHHRKGYDAGAVDFLSKPFIPEILLSKVKVFLNLYKQRLKVEELAKQNAELYELEKDLRTLQENRAQELAKLNASKDLFFSVVSQDLHGPVSNMVNLSNLMLMAFDRLTRENIKDQIEQLHNSAKATNDLLENLSTWSQLQLDRIGHQPIEVNLYHLFDNIIILFDDAIMRKEINIVNSIPHDMIVIVDKSKLVILLRNMISNAVKYSLKKGNITFSAVRNDTDSVEVSVADTGVGIHAQDINKLFQIDKPYSTPGTAKEPGAGLGLIICQALALKIGGDIWVDSEYGKGTTVHFTIPEKRLTPVEYNVEVLASS